MMKTYPTLIPIVLAFTPNYIIPASVCIKSILAHSQATSQFHFICLLTEDLEENQQKELQKLDEFRTQYTFINLKGKLNDIYIDQRYTEAASYRLLLPDLLPDYDQVMYIDCDVVVRNDLAKLYKNIKLQEYYLAGVFEATLDFQMEYMKTLGLMPGCYINSGFLVMNLKKMREDQLVVKLLEASKVPYLQFPDQDVLNQLCKGKILGLSPIYNSIRTFYLPQYKAEFLQYYSQQDWDNVQQHGTIHYTGAKPWNHFTVKFDIWWEYHEKLPASLKQLWHVNKKMYLLYRIYSLGAGRWIIDPLLKLYRKIKY